MKCQIKSTSPAIPWNSPSPPLVRLLQLRPLSRLLLGQMTDSMCVVQIVLSSSKPIADQQQLTQLVMNHHIDLNAKRTFEALSEYLYPSNPDKVLSTILLDRMSTLSVKTDIDNFPVALASIVISMWKQCVEEQYVTLIPILPQSQMS